MARGPTFDAWRENRFAVFGGAIIAFNSIVGMFALKIRNKSRFRFILSGFHFGCIL